MLSCVALPQRVRGTRCPLAASALRLDCCWEGRIMNKHLLIVGLLLMVVAGAGCVVIDVEKVRTCKPAAAAEPAETTIREIDAVGQMSFDHDRQSGYKRIAQREGLGEAAQVHLVEAVFDRLQFEHAKMDVLLSLVANPSFGSAGESAVLERVGRLSFEHNKRKVLDAIGDRKA